MANYTGSWKPSPKRFYSYYMTTRKLPEGFRKTGYSGISNSLHRIAAEEKIDKYILYPLKKGKYIKEMRYRLYAPIHMTWL